ncbi:sulfur carrier protein ThiS [Sediminibacillus dalangtanensis]|uniref:Sulfur carrier protein ThiS n=1 Tax=Sediminibacillus dalangtanensis TaxID=2729421 RepID=A0ABX7VNH0_9BACI|nr:sulfur carrier protein ThiS [Sediminibacillus dalangtanensis]QTM98404.1 sulfur carrier protein ThiS [Sediminibacillus dalangtanensis]
MELIINGDMVEVPDTIATVSSLLEYFGIGEKVVIVELNQNILEKNAHADTRLSDRDKIEIVNFVGGG